jgi:3-dehydroquinate synthase class II
VSSAAPGVRPQAGSSTGALQQTWRAESVSELQPGQEVYLLLQEAARHTGISIQERISEK